MKRAPDKGPLASIRSRLLVAIGLIVLLATSLSWFSSRQITRAEFELDGGLVQQNPEALVLRTLAAKLVNFEQRGKGWDRVAALVDEQLAATDYKSYVLRNVEGQEIVSSQLPDDEVAALKLEVFGATGPVATLLLYGESGDTTGNTEDTATKVLALQHKEDRSIVRSGRFSLAIAITLIALTLVVLSRVISRLMQPLANLSEGAERLAAGDYSVRIDDKAGDEIAHLGHTFNSMAERIELHGQRRQDLFNDVAHELRTPLTNLRARIESVVDGVAEPDTNEMQHLLAETMLLEHLTNDLQVLATAEAGALRLRVERLSLAAEVAAAIATARSVAPEVVFETSVASHAEISADQLRLRQILTNLLTNASRFSAGRPVTVAASNTEATMILSVRDRGPGIDGGDLDSVFDRFYRAESERSRDTGGSGLGLAIVQRLVQAHGGRVWAESEVGQGTVLFVELPDA